MTKSSANDDQEGTVPDSSSSPSLTASENNLQQQLLQDRIMAEMEKAATEASNLPVGGTGIGENGVPNRSQEEQSQQQQQQQQQTLPSTRENNRQQQLQQERIMAEMEKAAVAADGSAVALSSLQEPRQHQLDGNDDSESDSDSSDDDDDDRERGIRSTKIRMLNNSNNATQQASQQGQGQGQTDHSSLRNGGRGGGGHVQHEPVLTASVVRVDSCSATSRTVMDPSQGMTNSIDDGGTSSHHLQQNQQRRHNRKKKKKNNNNDDDDDDDDDDDSQSLHNPRFCFLVSLLLLVAMALSAATLSVVLRSHAANNDKDSNDGKEVVDDDNMVDDNRKYVKVIDMFERMIMDTRERLYHNDTTIELPLEHDKSSPQFQAYLWFENKVLQKFDIVDEENQTIHDDIGIDGRERIPLPPETPPGALVVYALATIYYATGGPTTWTRSDFWLSDIELVSVCERWLTSFQKGRDEDDDDDVDGDGIGDDEGPSNLPCPRNGRGSFVRLQLDELGLYGTIPMEIGLLTDLERFRARKNNLFGTLPTSISKLGKLTDFSMSFNQLSGPLPRTFSILSNLRNFRVNENRLTGTIPKDYAAWTDINHMRFHGNLFEVGSNVPSEICQLESYERITVDCDTINCNCCTPSC